MSRLADAKTLVRFANSTYPNQGQYSPEDQNLNTKLDSVLNDTCLSPDTVHNELVNMLEEINEFKNGKGLGSIPSIEALFQWEGYYYDDQLIRFVITLQHNEWAKLAYRVNDILRQHISQYH